MLAAAGSLIVCLLLHAAIARRTQVSFNNVFRLARGIVSVVLSAIGFFALLHWLELLPAGYMGRHAGDPVAALLVQAILGHFLADFLLLAWGWWREGAQPRPDLILHHGLGFLAGWVMFHYGIGHALFLVLFTTEMMPVTSGVAGWAALKHDRALERRAQQLRLAVLLCWRMPLWLVVGGLMLHNLFVLTPDPLLAVGYRFGLGFLIVMLSLDSFWIAQCVKGLRRWHEARARA